MQSRKINSGRISISRREGGVGRQEVAFCRAYRLFFSDYVAVLDVGTRKV